MTDDPAIGRTARGSLHREGDLLVRVLNARLCDERFRTAQAELRGQPPPRTLPIVRDGPSRDGYRIEYAVPPGFRTLDEAYAGAGHWHRRLALTARVCEAVDGWHQGRLATLGLDPYSVLLPGDESEAWLAPCPPVRIDTPRELFEADPVALATVAPEIVRGLSPYRRAEDAYALGSLAAVALGCRPGPGGTGADRVEQQARGVLLDVRAQDCDVEPPLLGADRLGELFRAVHRHRHHVPEARPADPAELRGFLLDAADLVAVAGDLWAAGEPAAALIALEPGDQGLPAHWLAARIHAAVGDGPAAFRRYSEAVRRAPTQFGLRRERLNDLLRLWSADPSAPPEWTETLTADIAHLRRFSGPGDELGLLLIEAEVHERAGDHRSLATTLHRITALAPGRHDILRRYAATLRALDADAEADQVEEVLRRREERIRQAAERRKEAG